MIFTTLALMHSLAFATEGVFERRVACAHLLGDAEVFHRTLIEAGLLTPTEAERTLMMPGHLRETKFATFDRWRAPAREVTVAVKPSGHALVLGSAAMDAPVVMPSSAGQRVEASVVGSLRPDGAGGWAWTEAFAALPLGDRTRRELYAEFSEELEKLSRIGELTTENLRGAIVLDGTWRERGIAVLKLDAHAEADYLAFDRATKARLTPVPKLAEGQYITLAGGDRLTTVNKTWTITWPVGSAARFAAAAKYPSWREFLGRYPEAVDSLPALPYLGDFALEETFVQTATDERTGKTYDFVILRPFPARYGESPRRSYGLWDAELRAWVDVFSLPASTFALANRNRVGLHLSGTSGWRELPPLGDVENFAKTF